MLRRVLSFSALVAVLAWPVGAATGSCDPRSFDNTSQQVVALLENAMSIEPSGPATVVFLSSGKKVSSQTFFVEGPEGDFVAVETSCMASCSGNGCGVTGCNVSGQDCSACSCTGNTCTAQCDCTKFSRVVPKD